MSEGPNGTGQVFTVQLSDVQSVEYPSLPEGLITRPTLAWLVANSSKKTNHDCLVTYRYRRAFVAADYVATIGPGDDYLDLRGWVTVTNESGATFKDAKLKLVAGDVHQVEEEMYDVVRQRRKLWNWDLRPHSKRSRSLSTISTRSSSRRH